MAGEILYIVLQLLEGGRRQLGLMLGAALHRQKLQELGAALQPILVDDDVSWQAQFAKAPAA